MSQFHVQSPKHCAKHGSLNVNKRYKKLFYALSTFIGSVLSLVLLIWFLLHPSKPEFYLREADIYQLSLSGSRLLNSSIQITLLSKNPNQKVGVYYDQLQVYASYKGQQITVDATLPPFYQGHQDSNLLTASLIGIGIPVAASFDYEVGRDQTAGRLMLSLEAKGQLRWKVGTWVSGQYRFNVDCVAIMAFGPSVVTGKVYGSSVCVNYKEWWGGSEISYNGKGGLVFFPRERFVDDEIPNKPKIEFKSLRLPSEQFHPAKRGIRVAGTGRVKLHTTKHLHDLDKRVLHETSNAEALETFEEIIGCEMRRPVYSNSLLQELCKAWKLDWINKALEGKIVSVATFPDKCIIKTLMDDHFIAGSWMRP
ncbi:hypothetical protein HHK36_029270 [Tetracentron sinense]|uniref:Late embryogenesis abundant protein LEA-2 subgroup domain-containing protein n=1 Tax=Tetracentron sinense TaxID=13715 RepID=A0A834YCY9_TETSI|nr:hypothetical protein HHK36_029270 [Tetracentron sinense]